MLSIDQRDGETYVETQGDFPDLVCDLAVLYAVVASHGAALGIDVPRLTELTVDTAPIREIARRYWEQFGGG